MKHQRPVVEMAARARKVIMGDDMGLGKCAQSISAVEESRLWRSADLHLPRSVIDGPKLVICPNSVKGTWRRELGFWTFEDDPFQIVDATTAPARRNQLERAIADNMWCVVNWEQIRAKKEEVRLRNGGKKKVMTMKEPLFEQTSWFAVIADEIHRAKSRGSQQRQGLRRCRADNGLMFGLTGTPIQNSPDELWPILEWMWPGEYTSFWRFYDQYVEFYETGGRYGGRVITGVKNPDALRFELKDRLVRRTQDILDLPGKHRIAVPIDLSPEQRRLYKEAEDHMWFEVEKDLAAGKIVGADAKHVRDVLDGNATAYRLPNGATRTLRLPQIIETPSCLGGKDDSATLDAAVDKVMDSRPEPWVIFCEFKATVEALVTRLTNKGLVAEPYMGGQANRPELEERFQAGQIDVLVGTIKAMKEGITLTAGNYQWWVSRDWVPAVNEQGEDRQHRIGQKSKVTIMIAEPQNTVATGKVKPTNKRKERIVRAVIPKVEIEES
jgi:SNF2 family DNA or RNA helicase